MTKYEKLSTVLSVFALIGAIASPFISYRWLDPQFQAFKNRPRLKVTGAPLIDPVEPQKPIPFPFQRHYMIEIVNIGHLPSKEIKIVSQQSQALRTMANLAVDDASADFIFDPLVPFEVVKKDDQNFITLTRPLAPQDKLTMTFKYMPALVVVSSEWGETATLDSGWRISGHNIRGPFDIFPDKKN